NDDEGGVNRGADGGSGGGAANRHDRITAASSGTSGQGYGGGAATTDTGNIRSGSCCCGVFWKDCGNGGYGVVIIGIPWRRGRSSWSFSALQTNNSNKKQVV
ncbi:MAG TPA: hypothetical protein P5069_16740, partial [Candidatus Hydrogenedentes bacterium]|nr:hypothetical protein [Candidatus Hydrogenedentota bacterium]